MKRKNRDTPGRRIAQAIIAEYKPKSVAQMQSALKEVFGPMFEAILNGEMESYLGYEPNSREENETTNRRNGYFDKSIKTSMGDDRGAARSSSLLRLDNFVQTQARRV